MQVAVLDSLQLLVALEAVVGALQALMETQIQEVAEVVVELLGELAAQA